MIKRNINHDSAVSPVIGVLLMLVVTIIIAAVVSAFAGGMTSGTTKAPQASLIAKEFVVNGAHNPAVGAPASDVYIVFENKGGDGIGLNNIQIKLSCLKYPHQASLISNAIIPNSSQSVVGDKSLISGFSKSWTNYLEGYPNNKDQTIAPGSQFVLHVDRVAGTGTKTYYWQPETALSTAANLPIYPGDYLVYDIIDKASGKSISAGQIKIPDYTVT